MKIYKYELQIIDFSTILMPIGAAILSCQTQKGAVFIWAMVDPSASLEGRTFEIIGTGNPISKLLEGRRRMFVATVQEGGYVWHVFEIVKVDEVTEMIKDISKTFGP